MSFGEQHDGSAARCLIHHDYKVPAVSDHAGVVARLFSPFCVLVHDDV